MMISLESLEETNCVIITDANGSVIIQKFQSQELLIDNETSKSQYFTFKFFNMKFLYKEHTQCLVNVSHKIQSLTIGELHRKFEFGRSETEIDELLKTFLKNEPTVPKGHVFHGLYFPVHPKDESNAHIPKVSITDRNMLFSLISHCVSISVEIIQGHYKFQQLSSYKHSYEIVTKQDKVNFSICMDDYYFYDNHFYFVQEYYFYYQLCLFKLHWNFQTELFEKYKCVFYSVVFQIFFVIFCQIGEKMRVILSGVGLSRILGF